MPSLYRKWRSRSFDDIVGQEHIVRTLRNAVRTGRVAHAYLFTGPRGTGKTSTARILAKAVNCLTPRNGNPCNECETCRAADEGRALDVIEVDAASNTSVDNVRDLRERVAYAAGEGRYKVYIVDEVHRLSGAAFDAFLKTLEEPPPHVIFVFASTEPHKVPATIASRCQRFDFRRFTAEEILGRLKEVVAGENLDVREGALRLIALQGGGSMRDALGLLDQVTSYTTDQVTEDVVRAATGLADPLLISRLTDCLLTGGTGEGLRQITDFVQAGGDPGQLTRQIVEYWRALLFLGTKAPGKTLEIDPALGAQISSHVGRLTQQQILHVIGALTSQGFSSKYNLPPSLPLETGYVQASELLKTPTLQPPMGQAPRPQTLASAQVSPPTKETAKPSPPTPPPNGATPEDPAPAGDPAAVVQTRSDGNLDDAWTAIVANMRSRSPTLQALLRSGYLMKSEGGELTVGFLFDFHVTQVAAVKQRRLLEEVVSETLGSAHRVRCVKVSKEEVEATRGTPIEDDGFVEEAAERIRQYHIKQLHNGTS